MSESMSMAIIEVFQRVCVLDLPYYDASDPMQCEICNDDIIEPECYRESGGSIMCRNCYASCEAEVERGIREAPARIAEAVARCRVTGEFPEYDESLHHAPTRVFDPPLRCGQDRAGNGLSVRHGGVRSGGTSHDRDIFERG